MEIVAVEQREDGGMEVEQILPPKHGIDSLSYADPDFEIPGVREAAIKLVEEEMLTFRPSADKYLSKFPTPAPMKTDNFVFLNTEMDRIANKKKQTPVDLSKTEMPKPIKSKQNDIAAWAVSVDNAKAQLLQMKTRLDNLDLFSLYGSQLWKKHLGQVKKIEEYLTQEVANLSDQIQQVNFNRKTEQTDVGKNLYELEVKWGELVSKNFEIECACKTLEQQIETMAAAAIAK